MDPATHPDNGKESTLFPEGLRDQEFRLLIAEEGKDPGDLYSSRGSYRRR